VYHPKWIFINLITTTLIPEYRPDRYLICFVLYVNVFPLPLQKEKHMIFNFLYHQKLHEFYIGCGCFLERPYCWTTSSFASFDTRECFSGEEKEKTHSATVVRNATSLVTRMAQRKRRKRSVDDSTRRASTDGHI